MSSMMSTQLLRNDGALPGADRAIVADSGRLRHRAADGAFGGLAGRILDTTDSYEGRKRTGNRLVGTMFGCLLICYVD